MGGVKSSCVRDCERMRGNRKRSSITSSPILERQVYNITGRLCIINRLVVAAYRKNGSFLWMCGDTYVEALTLSSWTVFRCLSYVL